MIKDSKLKEKELAHVNGGHKNNDPLKKLSEAELKNVAGGQILPCRNTFKCFDCRARWTAKKQSDYNTCPECGSSNISIA